MADDWISAHDAYETLGGLHPSEAIRAICTWAYEGAVPSRAKLLRIGFDSSSDAPIPRGFWWSQGGEGLIQDWNLGNFEATVRHYHNDGVRVYSDIHYRAFGVEFERGALVDMLPQHLKPTKVKRGRPAKYDWNAASEAIRQQIKSGTLRPALQADVERALQDFFSDKDVHPGEQTIRNHAKPIWLEIG